MRCFGPGASGAGGSIPGDSPKVVEPRRIGESSTVQPVASRASGHDLGDDAAVGVGQADGFLEELNVPHHLSCPLSQCDRMAGGQDKQRSENQLGEHNAPIGLFSLGTRTVGTHAGNVRDLVQSNTQLSSGNAVRARRKPGPSGGIVA